MITASNVKDYLKGSIDGVNNWFSGSLRSNKEKGICIYSKQAMGRVQGYSILIHWNKNASESEQKAMEVYEALWGQNPVINKHKVIKIDLRDANPIGVGVDDNGIYEFVINFDILYER